MERKSPRIDKDGATAKEVIGRTYRKYAAAFIGRLRMLYRYLQRTKADRSFKEEMAYAAKEVL